MPKKTTTNKQTNKPTNKTKESNNLQRKSVKSFKGKSFN